MNVATIFKMLAVMKRRCWWGALNCFDAIIFGRNLPQF